MSIKSLMYYFVVFDGNEVTNLFYRGICVPFDRARDWEPGKFCKPPEVLTMKQATLFAPLFILSVLYLPTLIYVTVISVRKFRKNMKIHDKAILFIFPIFTNLCFIKPAEKQIIIDCRNMKSRSKSESDILPSLSKPVQMSRSKSSTKFNTSKIHFNTEILEPNLSLVHSNVLYAFFFIGTAIVLGLDLALQLARNHSISDGTKPFIAIFVLNIVLWIDFNIHMAKRRIRTTLRSVYFSRMFSLLVQVPGAGDG